MKRLEMTERPIIYVLDTIPVRSGYQTLGMSVGLRGHLWRTAGVLRGVKATTFQVLQQGLQASAALFQQFFRAFDLAASAFEGVCIHTPSLARPLH